MRADNYYVIAPDSERAQRIRTKFPEFHSVIYASDITLLKFRKQFDEDALIVKFPLHYIENDLDALERIAISMKPHIEEHFAHEYAERYGE